MRRTLAAAILGISLWVGSLAWSAFVMTNTVLDPDRSRDVADALYDDPVIRAQLAENIAGAVAAGIPPGVDVPRPLLDQAATTALDSPAVELLFVDAFVATHGAFLGSGDAPEAIEAGAFGAATRDALVASQPGLDPILPAAPSLRVPLPTERVPNLGPVRDVLAAAVPVLGALSLAGVVLAFAITSNRPAILRRAGVWAIGLSLAVLFIAYGIPAVAERLAPDQSQIVAAFIGAIAASTRGPAVGLAAAGGGLIVASFVWRVAPVAIGAAGDALAGDPGAPTPQAPRRTRWWERRDVATPVHRTAAPVTPIPSRPRAGPATRPAAGPRRPDPDGFARTPRPPVVDPTAGYPDRPPPTSTAPPTTVQAAAGGDGASYASPTGRHWVEGVGWVLDPSSPIPAEARWVPGVGYVVEA